MAQGTGRDNDAMGSQVVIFYRNRQMRKEEYEGCGEELEQNGYLILRNYFRNGELDELQDDLEALGRWIIGPEFSATHRENYTLTPERQSLLYDRLSYMPALSRLSGSKDIQQLCRRLGMAFPSLMGCCNMRLDPPGDDRHLFAWHQDSLYLLGSTNAVTLWLPLGDVDLVHGTIQVIPGSHKKGIYPFRKISDKQPDQNVPFLQRDLCLDYEVTEMPETIVARRGDLVVFRQMLLHRSTPNRSDQIRWTAQLRITDLGEVEHQRQRFPTGDRTNIFYADYTGFKHPLTRN